MLRLGQIATHVGEWFDRRLQLAAPIREIAEHPVPRNTASWWYVFGSAALTVFVLQIVTGILLALIYVPSAAEAWSSLQALNHDIALGWFIRALHGWGSNFMVAIVLIHMVQVFLFGAYKFPRELTWIVGVFLLLMTLGMAFTGQVLRFDQDAYWGLGIGASIASRVPIMGPAIVKLMLGGPIIAGATLSRFFALHVFVIPGLLIGFVMIHLLMVIKLGINEWPMPGRVVKRATYEKEYHELTKTSGAPFVPYAVWKDMFFAAFILFAVAACAFYFGPFGPSGMPDPTVIQTAPRPDYFFLWLYGLLSYLPPSLETPALLIGPVVAIGFLVLLPFLSGEGEKSWRRRPIAVLTVLLIAIVLGTLTHLAGYTPWSPHMNAWSGDPVPDKFLHGTTALQRQGALVFQGKQCRNCHFLGDSGGQRGPALDSVAVRLTEDQLIRQVIQGGGNMPAYGNNLSPAETTALVAFLTTLHPPNQAPARDAARDMILRDQQQDQSKPSPQGSTK
jgi:ubiquinol-cytochrome c reductase cytochrome b subunit